MGFATSWLIISAVKIPNAMPITPTKTASHAAFVAGERGAKNRIKTPTLFLCGGNDFNVPLLNSEQMYQALRSLNVPTELIIYPGQFHSLKKPSYFIDRYKRCLDWYAKWITAKAAH